MSPFKNATTTSSTANQIRPIANATTDIDIMEILKATVDKVPMEQIDIFSYVTDLMRQRWSRNETYIYKSLQVNHYRTNF